MSANPRSTAEGLIATLFGIDDFSTFVGHFSASIESHVRLDSPFQAQLDIKRSALAQDAAMIARFPQRIQAWTLAARSLSEQLGPDLSIEAAEAALSAKEGPLQALAARLDEPVAAQIGVSRKAFGRTLRAVLTAESQHTAALLYINNRALQVSHQAMYRAILALRSDNAARCPACTTPLGTSTADPYRLAEAGLAGLEGLESRQAEVSEAARRRDAAARRLLEYVTIISRHCDPNTPRLLKLDEANRPLDTEPVLAQLVPDGMPFKSWASTCLRKCRELESRDSATREVLAQRDSLIVERDRLRELQVQLRLHRERRAVLEQQLVDAQQRSNDFDVVNAELIAKAAAEPEHVARERRVLDAYADFKRALDTYLEALPSSLLAGLSATTKQLYNRFNRGDRPEDLFDSLTLPLRPGDDLLVSAVSDPQVTRNALLTLSEGHIRCLGLAILLAKAIQTQCAFVVLDDIVNAVDHEHRRGIRDTLFGFPALLAVQFIITCHSEEYIKDLAQQLPTTDVITYTLIPHDGDRHPRVQMPAGYNYVARARRHYDEIEYRECLAHCRRAVENLTERTWRKVQEVDAPRAVLRVRVSGPGAKPDLYEVVSQLSSACQMLHEPSQRWLDRQSALRSLLGIPQASLAWKYLNGGTHEEPERDDFDSAIVGEVVSVLERWQATFA